MHTNPMIFNHRENIHDAQGRLSFFGASWCTEFKILQIE